MNLSTCSDKIVHWLQNKESSPECSSVKIRYVLNFQALDSYLLSFYVSATESKAFLRSIYKKPRQIAGC